MKTENQLTIAILEITMKIHNEYPELIKYLAELPITIPDTDLPEINTKVLKDYLESLEDIIKEYSPTHKLY